jgi:hypothetical protein
MHAFEKTLIYFTVAQLFILPCHLFDELLFLVFVMANSTFVVRTALFFEHYFVDFVIAFVFLVMLNKETSRSENANGNSFVESQAVLAVSH